MRIRAAGVFPFGFRRQTITGTNGRVRVVEAHSSIQVIAKGNCFEISGFVKGMAWIVRGIRRWHCLAASLAFPNKVFTILRLRHFAVAQIEGVDPYEFRQRLFISRMAGGVATHFEFTAWDADHRHSELVVEPIRTRWSRFGRRDLRKFSVPFLQREFRSAA